MFIGTGACSSSDHRFDDARSGSWAKWEETRWKESRGKRKGECFTCTIWSHWSTHGWVSYLNGKARAVRTLSKFCRCDFCCLPPNIRRLRSCFFLGGGSELRVWGLPTAVQFPGFIHSWAWLTCSVRKVIRQSWNESQITAHEIQIQFFSQRVPNYRTQPFFPPPKSWNASFISKQWRSATGCDAGSPVSFPILAVFEWGDRNTLQPQPRAESQEIPYNNTIYYTALSDRWTCLTITFVKHICNRILMENDENHNKNFYSNLYAVFSKQPNQKCGNLSPKIPWKTVMSFPRSRPFFSYTCTKTRGSALWSDCGED